jgi:hypothetical protein
MIIMPPKSKVEKSPHFNEILDMVKEGLSPRSISNYLEKEYNETISHTAINNYVKKIRSKTSEEYFKKKKQKEVVENQVANSEAVDEIVEKGVSDLEALDNIIKEAKGLNLNIDSIEPYYGEKYCANSDVEIERLKIQAKRLAVQAVKVRSDILKEDPEPPNVNLNYLPVIIQHDEEKELKKEIEDELR